MIDPQAARKAHQKQVNWLIKEIKGQIDKDLKKPFEKFQYVSLLKYCNSVPLRDILWIQEQYRAIGWCTFTDLHGDSYDGIWFSYQPEQINSNVKTVR